MRSAVLALALAVVAAPANAQASKEVTFYSEGVQCHGKIFTPEGWSASSKSAAVVLAPAPGETAASIEKYAAALAAHGLVAMAIDYRGWGKSGGFLNLAEPVRWDDRLRFSQHTAQVRITRKRSLPEHQLLDIRNAISFLQGEAGVDRRRIGVWGTDIAGGHAVVVAATDARVKAIVAQTPVIPGKDVPRKAFAPTAEQQAAMIRQARTAPAEGPGSSGLGETEARIAMAQYQPIHYADAIPPGVAVLFVTAAHDTVVNNETHAVAASKLLKGATAVTSIPGATHAMSTSGAFEAAAKAAADWFVKYLGPQLR